VVGRLAQRHGIRVQLRRSWYDGVTAAVLLPLGVLVNVPERDQMTASERRERVLSALPAEAAASVLSPVLERRPSDWFNTISAHYPPLRRSADESSIRFEPAPGPRRGFHGSALDPVPADPAPASGDGDGAGDGSDE